MNRWPTQAQIASIKARYPVGTRIELVHMDEAGMPPGLKGVIDYVDDMGQLHMCWENGRSLALVVGEDRFRILSRPEPELTGSHEEDENDMEP